MKPLHHHSKALKANPLPKTAHFGLRTVESVPEPHLAYGVLSSVPQNGRFDPDKMMSFSNAVRRFNLLWQSGTLI